MPKGIHFGGGEFIAKEDLSPIEREKEDMGLVKLECKLDFGRFEIELNPIYRTDNAMLGQALAMGAEALEKEMADGNIDREGLAKNLMEQALQFGLKRAAGNF